MKRILVLLFLAAAARAETPGVMALIVQADAEERQHHTRGALTVLHEAEKLDPKNVGVLLRISRQYSDLVDTSKSQEIAQKSLDYAKRALELDPKSAKAHLSVAVGYGKLTDFVGNKTKIEYSKTIKEETEKSLALDPKDDFAWYLLGRWHFGVANVNGVLRTLARMIYGGLPPASNEEAAKCLAKAAELAPQQLMHHSALARVYTAMGKTDLAAKEWRTVLTLKAEDSEEENDRKEAQRALGASAK